jgi:hypothetical protein
VSLWLFHSSSDFSFVFRDSLPEDHLRLNDSYNSLRKNHPHSFVVEMYFRFQRQGLLATSTPSS